MKLNKIFEKSNEYKKYLSSGLYYGIRYYNSIRYYNLNLNNYEWIFFDVTYFNVWVKENFKTFDNYEEYK